MQWNLQKNQFNIQLKLLSLFKLIGKENYKNRDIKLWKKNIKENN